MPFVWGKDPLLSAFLLCNHDERCVEFKWLVSIYLYKQTHTYLHTYNMFKALQNFGNDRICMLFWRYRSEERRVGKD